MTKLQRFILKHICRKLVIQGPWHQHRMTEYYRVMHEAAKAEFTEDTKPTLDGFLRECFEDSLKKTEKRPGNSSLKL